MGSGSRNNKHEITQQDAGHKSTKIRNTSIGVPESNDFVLSCFRGPAYFVISCFRGYVLLEVQASERRDGKQDRMVEAVGRNRLAVHAAAIAHVAPAEERAVAVQQLA